MKRIFVYLLTFILLCVTPVCAKRWLFVAHDGTIGGTEGKLDNIDACNADDAGYDLIDKDGALVWDQANSRFLFYIFDIDSGASESDPDIVMPDECDSVSYIGDGRWLRSNVQTDADVLAVAIGSGVLSTSQISDVETDTHADEHAKNGADPVSDWYWGGALTTNDSTPAVVNGYMYDCTGAEDIVATSLVAGNRYMITAVGTTDFTAIGASASTVGVLFTATDVGEGTGTASIVILDFVDSTGDHSDFSDGDMIRVLMNDPDARLACSTTDNATSVLECNSDTDFDGLSAQVRAVDFTYRDNSDGMYWYSPNLNDGSSDAMTLAIGKAALAYTIAVPYNLSVTSNDAGYNELDITLGTEIESSTVYLTGDDDGDPNGIRLQDCPAGFDGTTLNFKTVDGVDITDSFTIDVETESTCINCPFSGIFTIYNTSATLSLRCQAGVGWHFEDFYHPVTNYYTLSTVVGLTSLTTTNIYYRVDRDMVLINFNLQGTNNNSTTLTFTVPYTSKNTSGYNWVSAINWKDAGNWQNTFGRISFPYNSTTVSVYTNALDGAFTDDVLTKGAQGQFTYQAN